MAGPSLPMLRLLCRTSTPTCLLISNLPCRLPWPSHRRSSAALWTRRSGPTSWRMPLPSARPPYTLKLGLEPADSFFVCPLAARGWNHWCLSLSYGCVSMSLEPVPTLGVPDAMPSSSPMGTIQECVRLEGSAHSAIMRSGTLFSSGVNAAAFALSVSGPACCSRSNLMT